MNTVEPIRDWDLIQDIADYLKDINPRDYVMFYFGIHTGLRISDILPLKVREVRDKDHVYIREQKTGKEKLFLLTDEIKAILKEYIQDKKDWEYLFVSRKKNEKGHRKPISREQAYRILNGAAKTFGLENIGTHTLRKTFGYWMYMSGVDIEIIRDILNHSSIEITRRYIGIRQDEKDKAMSSLSFKKRKPKIKVY